MTENATLNRNGSVNTSICLRQTPTASQLFHDLPDEGFIIVAAMVSVLVAILAIYAEEVYYILKHFKVPYRRSTTLWILCIFPVYGITNFLAVLVPRSSTLVDVFASGFMGSVLYQFVLLMGDYMGGRERLWQVVGTERQVRFQAVPCCCCCCCCCSKTFTFNRRNGLILHMMVLQGAIVRPLLMFVAAVLWTNGTYHPGAWSPSNSYIYIALLNLASTLPSIYGLNLLRQALHQELQDKYNLAAKLRAVQLTIVVTVLVSILMAVLVFTGVIECTELLPTSDRATVLTHIVVLFLTLPLTWLGRVAYRRSSDGQDYAAENPNTSTQPHNGHVATISPPTEHKINQLQSNQLLYNDRTPNYTMSAFI